MANIKSVLIALSSIFSISLCSGIQEAGENLKMVIEICRHGARAPIWQNYNVTGTYWAEGLGMLTEKGKQQHYHIGQALRTKYIDNIGLLDHNYNSSQLLVLSSYKERCIQSAQSQLSGFYPNTSIKLVSLSKFDPINTTNTPQIPIYQVAEKSDYLLRAFSENTCPKMADLFEQHYIDDMLELENLLNYYKKNLFIPLSMKIKGFPSKEAILEMSWESLMSIIDEIQSAEYDTRSGQGLNLTANDRELINQFHRDKFYVKQFGGKNREAAFLGSSEIKMFIAQSLNDSANGKDSYKLVVLSTHDTLQTMLLAAMGLEQDEAPPFAATIVFELWKSHQGNYSVKLLYNDAELDLNQDYCGQQNEIKSCGLNTFVKKLLVDRPEGSIQEACERSLFSSFNWIIIAYILVLGVLITSLIIVYRRRQANKRHELVEERVDTQQ